jgi:precorrin-3B C17-methyltransferase
MSEAKAGRLYIIGLGPGDDALLTEEARAALEQAQDIIGYAPYVARAPLRAGQTRLPSDNRVEIDRAVEALARVARGRIVAVVSGGDPGVFAMASAIFEAVEHGDPAWRELDIRVLPGISAMQAAAARLGAPLGSDFCVISLSDNLKPWELIAKRLEYAARADFVIAVYNPASRARPTRIHDAFSLLRGILAPHTLVVFAKSVARAEERLIITTLCDADVSLVDMSTLVIIGARGTRALPRDAMRPWIYTSRKAK